MAMPTSRRQVRPSQAPVVPFNREKWMALGACAEIDPSYELFFPENRVDEAKAKAICSVCPVAWECLDFSIRTEEAWGIWGGMTFAERCDLTHQYRGHTSSAARAAHRRHITDLNRKKTANAHRNSGVRPSR